MNRHRGRCWPLIAVGLILVSLAVTAFVPPRAPAFTPAPGGFLERAGATNARPRLTRGQLRTLLPERGKFTFPAPYHTEAVRLTNATDCAGSDCVNPVGYAYWRNINNHVGSDTLLVLLGLNKGRGGPGPSLFSVHKLTGEVRRLGPVFDPGSPFSARSGEGWYFSATRPTTLYLSDGPRLLRYDVATRQFQTVFDVRPQFGHDKYIWQTHSSDDDRVHSATLRRNETWEMLGCLVYREDTRQFSYYPKIDHFDECQIDKGGRWLVIKEAVDQRPGEDNRIIDLHSGAETILLDQDGAAGHSDNGHGYLVADDNANRLPGAVRVWKFSRNPLEGPVVFHRRDWRGGIGHISHTNAKPDTPPESQYACGGTAARVKAPHLNEILCFRLDTSLDVLVVAPVMTDLDASGGGDDYSKLPKGNLDVTGQYFLWSSNMASERLDAFIVKIPAHLLTGHVPGDVERRRHRP